MRRAYHILDVFTETPLTGNPLAVVLDAEGLDDARMQAIAGEFNLAETVFVREPRDPVNSAALRIFTPARELPFAGHPTVGTAALLAHLRAPQLLAAQDLRLVLEEKVGDVVCVARHRRGKALAAYFTLPRLPEPGGPALDAADLAARLGLAPEDIGFGAHRPTVYGAGVDFIFAPIRSAAALAKANPDRSRWGEGGGPSLYLYTNDAGDGAAYRARMFGLGWGIREDPATGSAASGFAGVVMAFDPPGDGDHTLVIEQGVEMGRPSAIALGLEVEGGALRSATIGGSAVLIGQGTIDL
ncbi:MAG: PhzF family phenazine biosynthesis protein [Hyphomicrobiales bacterium]|nr:PhzF family phenazine biosynthesis protein [Hyphomicrobiales bacterium]